MLHIVSEYMDWSPRVTFAIFVTSAPESPGKEVEPDDEVDGEQDIFGSVNSFTFFSNLIFLFISSPRSFLQALISALCSLTSLTFSWSHICLVSVKF